MNNDELKKKIVAVLKPAIKAGNISCNEENACKKCWFPCEIERTSERLADALIAAGIGDTSDLEVKCEVLQRDVDNLTRTMEEGAEELKEAQHRWEVAERALFDIALYCAKEDLDYFSLTTVAVESRAKELYGGWVRQAEKELADERKDHQNI